MPKKSRLVFLIASIFVMICATIPVSRANLDSSSSSYVIEIHNTLFCFGWSSASQEQLLLDGELVALNTKALVQPPTIPIQGDAGPAQNNAYLEYANNIGFSFAWSAQTNDHWRPSQSMTVGSPILCDGNGVSVPADVSIHGDGGVTQLNPSDIYFNNIGFSFFWSSVPNEDYRPSNSMKTGTSSDGNRRSLVPPAIPSEVGSEQSSSIVMYVNNAGFFFGWSANPGETWCPSHDMKTAPQVSLNTNALTGPPLWAIGIDNTPPVTSDNYDGLWHNNDFTVTLTAIDNESGVFATFFRINSGLVQNTTISGQPRITVEGSNNTLEYWSIDSAGNEELPHKILSGIKLDKTPPEIGVPSREPASNTVEPSQDVTVQVNASDSLSGLKNLTLVYNTSNNATWLNLPMTMNASNGLYQCTIPAQDNGVQVSYKISAHDNADNNMTEDNAGGYYTYNTIPEFSHIVVLSSFMVLAVIITALYRRRSRPRSVMHSRVKPEM